MDSKSDEESAPTSAELDAMKRRNRSRSVCVPLLSSSQLRHLHRRASHHAYVISRISARYAYKFYTCNVSNRTSLIWTDRFLYVRTYFYTSDRWENNRVVYVSSKAIKTKIIFEPI